jgi:pimeloyl-ACP methyl ester carboxylesterase
MFTECIFDPHELGLKGAIGAANGPPIVFLHGVLRGWGDFAPLFPAVLPRWRPVAVDFRGHGRSARAPGNYLVIDYVEDALAVLTSLDEPAVLFGHSLGALAAAGAAAHTPGKVRAIVLEDPPSALLLANIRETSFFSQFTAMKVLAGDLVPVPELARQLAALPITGPGGTTQRLGDFRDAASLRFLARCLKDVDPEVLTPLNSGRWLEGYDVEATMRGVKCPALILRGDEAKGGMLNRREAEQWAAWMSDATLIDVPGVGHLIHWMETETTIRLLLSFLESLR